MVELYTETYAVELRKDSAGNTFPVKVKRRVLRSKQELDPEVLKEVNEINSFSLLQDAYDRYYNKVSPSVQEVIKLRLYSLARVDNIEWLERHFGADNPLNKPLKRRRTIGCSLSIVALLALCVGAYYAFPWITGWIKGEDARLVEQYGDSSLPNASLPYSEWYGKNMFPDFKYPHSEIRINASKSADVVVIVRYDNSEGEVAGHIYVQKGQSGIIFLKNGYTYQTFFYTGNGWYPDKKMKGEIRGGFVKDEYYSKDNQPHRLTDEVLTYTLQSRYNGNFKTKKSSESEVF